ncbi:uncharacterized protein N7515_003212 [Penicillium bovifimosum]|uniref:Uncharacterized protein n=1 Tax=Penicillium bovifimosum TaxID=126998 RepID=A0A9W9H5K8_9EURO|nr:uncharacterized protein N7515_003212 [Penicillium bovifimosum]KAJ5138364.1 hypothetical protein N7515_003212 [Penicillium bovifimosum]
MGSSSVPQEPIESHDEQPTLIGGESWRNTQGGWIRECIGGEHAVSYNQNVRDGHTELTCEVPFSASVSTAEVIQRVRNCWLTCHASHPEIAIQLTTGRELPQMMKFEPLQSDADVAEWLHDTFEVVTDRSARDVVNMTYSRRLPTKGKRSMLYLVTAGAADPANPTRHYLVWNMGHVMADAYSVVLVFNHIFSTITRVPGDRNLTLNNLDYRGILDRLPVSPVTTYQNKYKPTQNDVQESLNDAIAQSNLYASNMSKSLAMYPEPDKADREHKTHCIRLQYTLAESKALLAGLREEKLSITFAAAAATVLAVKQVYGKGHETGALLGMTRNARRWIDTSKETGNSIPNAADTVLLWVPFKEEWFRGSTRDTILSLGRAIKNQLGPHLVSPHYLSSISFGADKYVASLANSDEPSGAPCPPGFSPQGALPLGRSFSSKTASIEVHDIVHTGRQIHDSAWVGMFSLWDQVTLSMGFDGKYYDPMTMDTFMGLTKSNLASLISPRYLRGITSKL